MLNLLDRVSASESISHIPIDFPTDFNDALLYGKFCKPELQKVLNLLNLDIFYSRAKGDELYGKVQGREIAVLDLLGGFGSTILGHNHPELQALLRASLDEDLPVHAQASIRSGSARLGKKLNEILVSQWTFEGFDRYIAHFLSTGTEATEAALKHALLKWQENKAIFQRDSGKRNESTSFEFTPVILAIEGSFHGKTAGSSHVTASPAYRSMYPGAVVETLFLKRNDQRENVKAIFDRMRISDFDQGTFSRIAGVFIEPIQGEGGIIPLHSSLISALNEFCHQDRVPLIVDEIQTGIFRTGHWFASSQFGIKPDYLLLGKSLGGGISKISALLVRSDHYYSDFSILHTSTFSEDEISARMALKTLDLLSKRESEIVIRAKDFEFKVRRKIAELQESWPGVIREVRGSGFMLGIEFDLGDESKNSHALEVLRETGYLIYVFASYLLNRHGIRVGASLNQSDTLRIEPSAFISPQAIEKVLLAFEDLIELLGRGDILKLLRPLLHDKNQTQTKSQNQTEKGDRQSPWLVSELPTYRKTSSPALKRVVFLSHTVDESHLKKVDPVLGELSQEERDYFLEKFGPIGGNVLLHEQVIEDIKGEQVLFELRGIFGDSRFFERSLRSQDGQALKKVRQAILRVLENGASYVGLGQYTSIVSDNGLAVCDLSANFTTGNSLTVGMTWLALKSALQRRNQEIRELHVGIVGVSGNICNVYAQLIGDDADRLTLVHREPYVTSLKFQNAVQRVIENSSIHPNRIRATHQLEDLVECDVVIAGTNSSRSIIFPQFLKKNALLVDVSVPSSVDPSVLKLRPDVEYVQGGFTKLPKKQWIDYPALFAPKGEVFSCLAETLLVGLASYPGHFSLGHLNKKKVHESLTLAHSLGFELGSVRRVSVI